MSEWSLNINQLTNDVELDDVHSLIVVTRAQAIGQHVRQRLKTFKGEWFLDSDVGVSWLDDILGKQYDPVITESIVKTIILKTPGVKGILAFSISFNGQRRELQIQLIEILTIYDEVIRIEP